MYGNEGLKEVKCPYDPNHVVRSYRLPYHLTKCKKNHPNMKLVNCVYDFSHLVKKEEFLSHVETCPSKIAIESTNSDEASREHESCKTEYEENYDPRSDCNEDSFHLVRPFETTVKPRDKERADYVALQKDYNFGSSMKEICFSSKDKDLLPGNDKLPPLQLPKTVSKAFQIEKSSSLSYK